jgi:hypothetical protein
MIFHREAYIPGTFEGALRHFPLIEGEDDRKLRIAIV